MPKGDCYMANGRIVMQRCREEAQSYQKNYGVPVLNILL